MISVQLNWKRLLAENLECRRRLGFSALPGAETEALQAWLQAPSLLLCLDSQGPLSSQGRELLAAMLKALKLAPEEVSLQPSPRARLTLPLLFTAPPDERIFCWHPDLLLQKPDLKKEAYAQLKRVRKKLLFRAP
ncbi:MAG: hypothetical protein LBJ14_02370 [Desulfarculales bacterium]|jgi:hypothetical protein|nr:hypothetical protein [Desulfarculales bacterium]